MVLTVRTDLLIGKSMEAANVHRRFRFGKVLAERAHMRPLMKVDPVGPGIVPPVFSFLRLQDKS